MHFLYQVIWPSAVLGWSRLKYTRNFYTSMTLHIVCFYLKLMVHEHVISILVVINQIWKFESNWWIWQLMPLTRIVIRLSTHQFVIFNNWYCIILSNSLMLVVCAILRTVESRLNNVLYFSLLSRRYGEPGNQKQQYTVFLLNKVPTK